MWARTGASQFSLLARASIGDAQVGPIYLGFTGVAVAHLRLHRDRDHRPQHAGVGELEPDRSSCASCPGSRSSRRSPNTACSIPPLKEGGWWLMAGFFLTTSILLWWVRMYRRARALGMGTHVAWAFASAIWLYLVLGFIRPLLMGQLERGGAVRHLPASRLDQRRFRSATATSSTIRSTCSRSRSSTARRCCSRCTARPSSRSAASAANARLEQIVDRGTALERAALFWRWTMGFNATTESIHRWAWWFAVLCPLDRRHRHPADRHRRR